MRANDHTFTGFSNFTNINGLYAHRFQAANDIYSNGYIWAKNGIMLGPIGANNTIWGMDCGTTVGTLPSGTKTVNFGWSFAFIPSVTATSNYAGIAYVLTVMVFNVTKTSFQYNILRDSNTHFEEFSGINWTAMCKI